QVCATAGRWRQAWQHWHSMEAHGIRPNLLAFNACIGACVFPGRWLEALSLLEQMAAAEVRANLVSYSDALLASARGVAAGCTRALLDTLDQELQMQLQPPN
ncbi:unnamed protein product, partial [Symbiodinium necroappetens]